MIANSPTTTVRARAIRTLPESSSWDPEAVEAIGTAPWSPNPGPDEAEAEVKVVYRPAPAAAPTERDEDHAPRALKVQWSDLDRWGGTLWAAPNVKKCCRALRLSPLVATANAADSESSNV